ncbi:MAG: lasso peptide isopeptide bond-forming cyclase [Calothrix sp. MO_167.B12]|nr:lasso peptide isopeptide bond-forming cyclase [Calothrix sp. MO_167.B12]
MSGIVGIYNLDGSPVECEKIGRMVDVLAHRGPDGANVWCDDDSVGFGHRMLWTTPESLLEEFPLIDHTGNLILTADARIDNRDELIYALEFKDSPAEKITDSDLILAAYEKWGRDCPGKLIGDFAFAIWDKHRQVLFCARDYMGVKPFYYYYQPGKLFVFASEIKGLFCLDAVPRKVNEAKVGIYLCQFSGFAKLKPDTFYKNILRLLPAHWMEVSERGIESDSFWDLDAEAKKIQQNLKTDAEYVEEFRQRFTEAIACRLRSAYPVSSTLSGGVDSSSVSCIARNLLREKDSNAELLTIYSDCGVPSADETAYVNTVLAQGGFKHHIAKVGNPISAAQTVTPWLDQPVQMPTPAMLLAIVREVKQQGARVMLTGHDGDTIVSHGQDYLNELVESGEWDSLKKCLTWRINNRKNESDSPIEQEIVSELYHYVLPYFKQLVKSRKIKKYFQSIYKLYYHLSLPNRRILGIIKRSLFQGQNKIGWQTKNPNLQTDFVNHVKLGKLVRSEAAYQDAYLPDEYLNHYRGITSGNLLDSTEQIDAISSGLNIETRHPFLDKRVIELCLATPASLKFCNDFGRGVMRRAMKNILPEKIRRRRSKVDFSGFIINRMENAERNLIEYLLLEKKSNLSNYLNTPSLSKDYQCLVKSTAIYQQKRRKIRMINCAIHLSLWLK